MKILILLSASLLALFTSGCVVGRRTVSLPVTGLGTTTVASKGTIYIGAITDNRMFENNPPEPSVPSIDGDVNSISAGQKLSMIGRQRNGYGHAMGDIALPDGDSVTAVTHRLLEEGLKHRGYAISTDAMAPNSATVSIDQFWAWFTPGMVSVSFEARVYCTITIKRADRADKVIILGYGLNKGQMASDENWQLAYQRAFQDFLLKLDVEFDKAGL
jgi:hypothetical protein